jgi:predicted DNA-binding protein
MARPPKHEVKKENLGVRLQIEWSSELKAIAQQTGRTLSDVAIEAIGKYLDKDVSAVSDELSDLAISSARDRTSGCG